MNDYPPQNNYSMPYLGYDQGQGPSPYAPPAGPPPGTGMYAPPAGPPPDKGYGAGAADLPMYSGDDKGIEDRKENPFEDFEEAPLTARPGDHERDVTSPRTGYRV
jgi:hypothetical protein